jgi:hypothetical protein
MCNVYERYRLRGSDATAFCFIDVKIQWNSDPSDIKISISNNGIFYFTYDGSGTNPAFLPNINTTEEEELYYGPGVSLLSRRVKHSILISSIKNTLAVDSS